jgi:hypothetical protein
MFQFGIWTPWRNATDSWLHTSTAEWMGYRINDYARGFPIVLGPEDMALDCRDAFTYKCSFADVATNDGFTRWSFYEYAFEKYGAGLVKDALTRGAAGGGSISALTALNDAFVAKGTTLSDVYNNWVVADITGNYSVTQLAEIHPVTYASTLTGIKEGTVFTKKIPVSHLATRIVEFSRGDGGATKTCYPAKLTLTVAVPSGSLSKPVFYWTGGGSPVPLSINGSTASTTVDWDTCNTTDDVQGYLALPNASLNLDGVEFAVNATMTVNLKGTVAPAAPPPPAAINTPVIPVSSAVVAPTISLFGPELLSLAAGETQIRLIVQSNAEGRLGAAFGTLNLGTVALRAGNNDLRFTLPAGAVASLRSSASASGVLTLTPQSTDGSVSGQTIAQKIRITPAAKTAAKAKAKAKKAKKPKAKAKPKTRRR